jgi:hypothetical protein
MEADALAGEHWPDDYEVDIDSLDKARTEEPYLRASFELLKEAAALTALAAGVITDDMKSGHDRNSAILCGHLVRMTKQTIHR